MPAKSEPLDALLAIATDLLAQAEAQHRAAVRLEDALRLLARDPRAARDRGSVPPIDVARTQARILRDLVDAECGLLEELERELSGASR